MELPGGGRVSGAIEVWAGDAAANDHLVQTEVIANLSYISFKKLATDSYSRSPPPLTHPQLPRFSQFVSRKHSCLGAQGERTHPPQAAIKIFAVISSTKAGRGSD